MPLFVVRLTRGMRDSRATPMTGEVIRRTLLSATLALAAVAPAAPAADLWVDGGSTACSDARTAAQVVTRATPWCSLAPAAAQARASDVVRIAAAVYRGTLRPLNSGTSSAPIRFAAVEPGVVLDAAGAANAVKLIGVSDVALEGMTVRGGASQGVWVESAPRAALLDLVVSANPGAGIQVKATSGLRVERSAIVGNGRAGILEHAGTTGARYVGNAITDNGIGGGTYGGDGIQLGGTGALVAGNQIGANSDAGPYEHGIYAAAGSSGWTIEDNELRDNGGANVKAAGGPGIVRGNHMTNGRYGIVLSDNPSAVLVEGNVLDGRAQHLVFLTAGATAARARLLGNTVVQSGRAATSGDASALFVNAAASLELRGNVLCYTGADALGVGLWVNDASRLGGFASDDNRLCSTDTGGRHFAWNGSRTTLAGWRAASGQDAHSLAGTPAAILPP